MPVEGVGDGDAAVVEDSDATRVIELGLAAGPVRAARRAGGARDCANDSVRGDAADAIVAGVGEEDGAVGKESDADWAVKQRVLAGSVLVARLPGGACDCPTAS